MKLSIQNFDVNVEKIEAIWVYRGVLEGGYKWAAQSTLKYFKKTLVSQSGEKMVRPDGVLLYPDADKWDLYNEPDWSNLPNYGNYPKGYWVAVWLRSYDGLPEKQYDFTEYRCIVFVEDFDNIAEQLKKIEWSKVCWDGEM